jgi:hypothetical protein
MDIEQNGNKRSATPLAGALLGLFVVLCALSFFAWLRNATLLGSVDVSLVWETALLRHNIHARLENATER